MPDSESDLTARAAGSGASTREWFASYDPASSSWRTSQASLFAGWDEFSETWPRSGMTQSGRAFAPATWVPRTGAAASSSSPRAWPTPVVTDSVGGGNRNLPGSNAHAGLSLTDVVTGGQAPRREWPTPNVPNGGRAAAPGSMTLTGQTPAGEKRQVDLQFAVQADWRSPSSRDWKGPSAQSWRDRETGDLTATLPDQILGLPDPANPSTPGSLPASSVVLNPAWVSCLMGFPPDWCDIGDQPSPRSATRSSRR